MPNAPHLPPLLFLPTPTVSSACCLVGLLHPTASHGVRAVSSPVSLPPHFCDRWSLVPFPYSHLTPSEAFPFTAAVLCHHIHFLPAVTLVYCFQSASARPQGFAPLCSPLSWRAISAGHGPDAPLGFVPLQGSPLILECSREVLRSFSAEADLLWTQSLARLHPGLAFTEVNAELERSCSSQRLCSGCRLPRHGMCRNTAPCRPADQCQPALESFERPLLRFLLSICQLRRSPASRLHALQRSFRYEVALISRVFSAQDRSPLTSCQAAICRI